MTMKGNLWQHMARYGKVWLHIATHGNLWQPMATYGNLWQHMAVSGSQFAGAWLTVHSPRSLSPFSLESLEFLEILRLNRFQCIITIVKQGAGGIIPPSGIGLLFIFSYDRFKVAAAFIGWTATTFVAHYSIKRILVAAEPGEVEVWPKV